MTLYHVILWLTYLTIRFIENPLKPLTWVYGGEIWIALLGTDKPHSTVGPGGCILSLTKQGLPAMTVAHRKLRVTHGSVSNGFTRMSISFCAWLAFS